MIGAPDICQYVPPVVCMAMHGMLGLAAVHLARTSPFFLAGDYG